MVLMGFPFLLVILFFITLLQKHHVLYAPSDFREDAVFVELFGAKSKRLYDDYVEQKTLDLAENSKKVVESLSSDTKIDTIDQEKLADYISSHILTYSTIHENDFKYHYFQPASRFEELIVDILRELQIQLINPNELIPILSQS